MSKISKIILIKVKKGEIERKSKHYYTFVYAVIWVSLVVAMIMGAFGVSMIAVQLFSPNFGIFPWMGGGGGGAGVAGGRPIGLLIKALPYFWLATSALLFTFIYYEFRYTKKGHRADAKSVVAISVIAAIVMGGIIYVTRVPHKAERFLNEKVGPYKRMHFEFRMEMPPPFIEEMEEMMESGEPVEAI